MRQLPSSWTAFRVVTVLSALGCFLLNALADAPAFRWAVQAGGVNDGESYDVALDALGNSYGLGGFTTSNAYFGYVTLTNGGFFVAKFDAGGNPVWARRIGPKALAQAYYSPYVFIPSIRSDRLGNVYVAANVNGATQGLQPDFEGKLLTNATIGFFLAKYNNNGALAWARMNTTNVSTNDVMATAFTVDEYGNAYVCASFVGTAGFDTTNLVSAAESGVILAKYDQAGHFVWARALASVDSPSVFRPRSLTIGPEGAFYMAGFFAGSVNLGDATLNSASSGDQDMFVAKYDAAGSRIWIRCASSAGTDRPIGLSVDAVGACYVSGQAGDALYDPGGPIALSFDGVVLTNTLSFTFLTKLDANGAVQWAKKLGEFTTDSPDISANVLYTQGFSTRQAGDSVGNTYLMGQFTGTGTFAGVTVANPSGGGSDVYSYFVVKIDNTGNVIWGKQFSFLGWSYLVHTALASDAAGNCCVAGEMSGTNAPFDSITLSLSPVSFGDPVGDFMGRLDAEPPRIEISLPDNSLVISWPTNQPGFTLEQADNLTTTNSWSDVTNAVTVVGIQNIVTNSIAAGSRFYRLRKP